MEGLQDQVGSGTPAGYGPDTEEAILTKPQWTTDDRTPSHCGRHLPRSGHLRPGELGRNARPGRQDLHDVQVPDDEHLYEGKRVSGGLGQPR